MPLLTITTSAPLPIENEGDLLKACVNAVSEALGKPESIVMVSLVPAVIQMDGSEEPAAHLELQSLGGLTPGINDSLTEILCDVMEMYLKISTNRTFVLFTDRERTHWGCNRKTFA